MPTTKKKAAAPPVNIKALAAELALPIKEGKVSAVRGKYMVTVGRKTAEIPVGELIDEASIKALVGQQVVAVVAGSGIVAIGPAVKPPWRCVLCYVAPPDWRRRIGPELRYALIDQYVKKQVIDEKLGDQLKAAMPVAG
jgi:hypothetical protein